MENPRIKRVLLLIFLWFMPIMVFADDEITALPLEMALLVEIVISLMIVPIFKAISAIISKENSKKVFWKLFITRIVFLIFCAFFITTNIVFLDIWLLTSCVFLIMPIVVIKSLIKNARNGLGSNQTLVKNELKCGKCNAILQVTDKVCPNCGSTVVVIENGEVQTTPKVAVLPTDFDKMYSLSESEMLEDFINRELAKAYIDKSAKLIPGDVLKRKNIFYAILSCLVFLSVTSIFFHFPIYTYVVELAIIFFCFISMKKYNLIAYLKKQIKARPSEKISNIVMNTKNTFVTDNSMKFLILGLLVSITLPLVIFSSPKIIYEKVDGGYAVRYYAFGLTNFKTVTIPERYKNEKVVSLRGNAFSNMIFLESVVLPDSIIEIRGQAFKNCYNLTEVNIPNKLEYLGGGAFANAISIKNIELPDTLKYLGGESFYNARSLESIRLSNNLTEIRGDSFAYCSSLKSITIPDNVTRIGGHAFYEDVSLSQVLISENSKLDKIGSSAFRKCSSLSTITIPHDTYVNERAFKESPTIVNRYGSAQVFNSDSVSNDNASSLYFKFYSENYFYVGDKFFIANSEIMNGDCQLSLDNIIVNGNNYEYVFTFSGYTNETIKLNNTNNMSYMVDDNLMIKITLAKQDGVGIKTYYN